MKRWNSRAKMNFAYSPEEWFTDWGWILESSLTLQKENSMEEARKFFRSRYTNPSEADWKLDRILKAYHYLDKHLDSFEKASLAVASPEAGYNRKTACDCAVSFLRTCKRRGSGE